MRIRCSECRKKILIDDAFAGGVCRCPYCKEMVFVPAGKKKAASAVVRPDRPMPVAAAPTPSVPTARPVIIQGILLVVLIAGAVMIFALVVLLVARYG